MICCLVFNKEFDVQSFMTIGRSPCIFMYMYIPWSDGATVVYHIWGHLNALQFPGPVLVGQVNLPRATWPIGVIQRTYQGGDGVVRMADVRTATGVKMRPAVKLYRLELYADNKELAPGEEMLLLKINNS